MCGGAGSGDQRGFGVSHTRRRWRTGRSVGGPRGSLPGLRLATPGFWKSCAYSDLVESIGDGVYAAEQRITRQEALRLFTINNAYLTFEENVKGSLEPGKLADLVVLSDDIMTCPVDKILDLTVLMTMVNGKIVFQHKEFLISNPKSKI